MATKHAKLRKFLELEYLLTNIVRAISFAFKPPVGNPTLSKNENTYGDNPADTFSRKFIFSHNPRLKMTHNTGSMLPRTTCHGASRSSFTFLDQFSLVLRALGNETCTQRFSRITCEVGEQERRGKSSISIKEEGKLSSGTVLACVASSIRAIK
jgi:hypothetical protein